MFATQWLMCIFVLTVPAEVCFFFLKKKQFS